MLEGEGCFFGGREMASLYDDFLYSTVHPSISQLRYSYKQMLYINSSQNEDFSSMGSKAVLCFLMILKAFIVKLKVTLLVKTTNIKSE